MNQHVTLSQNHMATTFHLKVSCAENRVRAADSVLSESLETIGKLERELSEFLPDSAVSRLNNAAPGDRVPAPSSLIALLEASEKWLEQTGGSFDPLVKSPLPPAPLRDRIDWSADGWACRRHRSVHLGFGAIGKGFALDQAHALLAREGFADFFLNAGGSSIVISGFSSGGDEAWSWGWSWKKDHEKYLGKEFCHRTGTTVSIGVSGLMERGHHIHDPRSGDGFSLQSALVACPIAADADALSTALFVDGWVKGYPILSQGIHAAHFAAAAIDAQGVPHWNLAFQKLWGKI